MQESGSYRWSIAPLLELRPEPEDVVLHKHRFSGIYQTELDDILCRLGIKNLIFTGCTTSVCLSLGDPALVM